MKQGVSFSAQRLRRFFFFTIVFFFFFFFIGYVSEQLAGNLAEGMKIHHEAFLSGGYSNNGGAPPPPPPYQPSFDSFGSRLGSHAASPYGISQCPVHRLQGCSCALNQCAREVSKIYIYIYIFKL